MPARCRILWDFSHLTAPSAAHLTTCFSPDSQHHRLSVKASLPLSPLQRFSFIKLIWIIAYWGGGVNDFLRALAHLTDRGFQVAAKQRAWYNSRRAVIIPAHSGFCVYRRKPGAKIRRRPVAAQRTLYLRIPVSAFTAESRALKSAGGTMAASIQSRHRKNFAAGLRYDRKGREYI